MVGGVLEWQVGGGSFAPFLAAVGFAVWFGGVGPGLVATALGAIAAPLILIDPMFSFEIDGPGEALKLVLYVASGALLVFFGDRVSRESDRADAAERSFADSEIASRDAGLRSKRLADENERLHDVSLALAAAATTSDVAQAIATHLFDALGATTGGIYLVDESARVLELEGLHGEVAGGAADEYRRIDLDAALPVTDVVLSGEPMWLGKAQDWSAYPEYERWRQEGVVSGAAIPLLAEKRVAASIFMGFSAERVLSPAERRFVETVSRQAVQPLERARLNDAEREARQAADKLSMRTLRLQVITESLSAALTPSEVGEVIVRQGVPALGADRATVYLRSGDAHVELLWDAGYPEAAGDQGRRLARDEAAPVLDVIHSGETLALESPEAIAARYPLLGSMDDEALLCAPLRVEEEAIGAILMAFSSRRLFDREQRAFLDILARQCAAALERAHRYETEREIAETLQQSVLPSSLPEVTGIELAACYLPGTSGLDVGGDWYDVIQLGESRVGVVVGDVMGKGVRAAAAMAQLRNGLRAYALEGFKPGSVLDRLNRLAESSDAPFATVVYVVLDHATGVARYASAGHPPVLLCRADGSHELLESDSGLPLGVDAAASYRTGVVELKPGDLLLLYTDGLVESRQRPIAQGIEELGVAIGASGDLDEILTQTIDRVLGTGARSDDVAVVALRLEQTPEAAVELVA